MQGEVLRALVASVDRRESVAVITVTQAEGDYAEAVGSHCVMWTDESRAPVGTLDLGEQTEAVLRQARSALYQRQHRQLEIRDDAGQRNALCGRTGPAAHI